MGFNSINSFYEEYGKSGRHTRQKAYKPQRSQNLGEEAESCKPTEQWAIIGVTGHANERSLEDYDEGDENEQWDISSIISAECAMAQSSRVRQPLERLDAERLDAVNTAVANTFLMNDERSATFNHFHGCQVTINHNIASKLGNADQQQ